MTKQAFLCRTCLPLLGIMTFGCSNASKAVDDAATITVGAESLRAVEIERSMTLGVDRTPDCVDFNTTLTATHTTVALDNGPTGCTLTVEQPGLELLDDQAVDRARKQTSSFDVNGIRGASLDVLQFDLSTAPGEALTLSQYVNAVSVTIDGQLWLDHLATAELEAGHVTRDLPAALVDKLKAALKDNQAASADISIALGIHQGVVLPDTLTLHLVMQPELRVNVIDAAL